MFKVTQWFGENPEYYGQFGLPGHEGIDLVAPHGQYIFSVREGAVYLVQNNPNASNYGKHVRVAHSDGFKTLYAHLDQTSVDLGEPVVSGQKVGEADNTGNSFGSHLHMGEKEEGVVYVDERGTEWPYNFRDPWLHLVDIYDQWLDSNGIVGYLYGPGLIENIQGTHARVFGTLNFRSSPSSSGELLGQVTTHTVVRLTGVFSNGYYQVVSPVDIPVTPPPGDSKFGLHFRADPDDNISAAEYNEQAILLTANGRTAKLLHNHPQSVFHAVCAQNPETIVVRVFESMNGRNLSPQQFYDNTIFELLDRISIVQSYGIEPIIEVHNEPNLVLEGLTSSWANGVEFGMWLITLIDLYRSQNALQSLKFIYPGLSPGGEIPNVRQDSTQFLQQSIQAGILLHVDGVACHAYWSNGWPMQTAIDHVNFTKATTLKPVWVTEVSRNDRPSTVPPEQYGEEYALFRNSIDVEGLYFFVGSASNLYFEPECWVTEYGESKGIAAAMVNAL